MQAVQNFFTNPSVQNAFYRTAQVVTTGLVVGTVNALWTRVMSLSTTANKEAAKFDYKVPFVVGFLAGAGFQTLRAVDAFSQPYFASFCQKATENSFYESVRSFFVVVR